MLSCQLDVVGPTASPSFSSPVAGAERMQETGHVCVFDGSDPRRPHHQPCVQLGGPSGPECVSTARQPGHKPETRVWHGGEDGKSNLWVSVCVVAVGVKKKIGYRGCDALYNPT